MNTSGNDMERKLFNKSTNGTAQMEIERLIAGETIRKTLNENLTHNEIDANIENTMKQIEEKDYTAILLWYRFKEIWTCGIAFRDIRNG